MLHSNCLNLVIKKLFVGISFFFYYIEHMPYTGTVSTDGASLISILSVPDPDLPGSIIFWSQGSGYESGSSPFSQKTKLKNFTQIKISAYFRLHKNEN
jgi:hypothetical protein